MRPLTTQSFAMKALLIENLEFREEVEQEQIISHVRHIYMSRPQSVHLITWQ